MTLAHMNCPVDKKMLNPVQFLLPKDQCIYTACLELKSGYRVAEELTLVRLE